MVRSKGNLIKEHRILAITECELDTLPVETLWPEEVEVTVWISEFSPVRYCGGD
jgi:hypothetical protein